MSSVPFVHAGLVNTQYMVDLASPIAPVAVAVLVGRASPQGALPTETDCGGKSTLASDRVHCPPHVAAPSTLVPLICPHPPYMQMITW